MSQEFAIADVVRRAILICAPAPEQPKSPSTPFAQLARQAYLAAQTDALGLTHLEEIAARSDDRNVSSYVEDAKRGTELMAELHHLIEALVPFEREVRAMIMAPSDQPEMPTATKPIIKV